jgi:two-component system NtrC family sensor kinase
LSGLEGASEVRAAVVNTGGILQVTTPRLGEPLALSPFVPPREPLRGWVRGEPRSRRPDYAYDWMSEAPWALVVTPASDTGAAIPAASRGLLPAVGLFLLMGVVILIRTRQVVGRQLATEQHEAELSGQLVHAAKLASVGELAAGIAHEINNPLAIIAEEVGELKDSMDPSLAKTDEEPLDLGEHLDAIVDAVFRCRDITRKLLTFVRQTDVKLEQHCVHEVLDDVLGTMLANELMLSNVNVVRSYDDSPATVFVDRNQLVQVFVNLVKNAIDAMPRGGVLTVSTMIREQKVVISVRDTGCGMSPDQLARVFTPFFTTKEPGMGTGLGLSVSYMIIQNFGGAFYVDSVRGKGSVFSVELPMAEELSAAMP